MPINQKLFNEIDDALGKSLSPSLRSASKASDLYEAWVFVKVMEAAMHERLVLRFRNLKHGDSVFSFRTSPGAIFSEAGVYSWVDIEFPKSTLELHSGVYVSGKSNAKHECDVSLIRKAEAEACRVGKCHPQDQAVLLAIECKMYQKARIGVGLGRGFLGLGMDLRVSECWFVNNVAAKAKGSGIRKLMAAHKKMAFWALLPKSTEVVDQFKDCVRRVLLAVKHPSPT